MIAHKGKIAHCQADYKDEEYWKNLLTIIGNSVIDSHYAVVVPLEAGLATWLPH
jgi:hypothetical protein